MGLLPRSEPREEELAALADGSLAPERREAVEAMAARSPELAARLDEQRRAVEHIRGAAATVEAPAGLRARAGRRAAPRPRRYVWTGAAAAAVAVAIALVLALPGNVPGGPSVAEAAALATRPPSEGPPAAKSQTLLAREVDGLPFPNWAKTFEWRATGVRADTVEGRSTTTVYYEKKGKRLAYTIVSGSALDRPGDATRIQRGPTQLRLLTIGGRRVITWERNGHTCVLSGAGVKDEILAKLAAWTGKGTVPG
jgi:hypothetical protein